MPSGKFRLCVNWFDLLSAMNDKKCFFNMGDTYVTPFQQNTQNVTIAE